MSSRSSLGFTSTTLSAVVAEMTWAVRLGASANDPSVSAKAVWKAGPEMLVSKQEA